MSRYVWQSKQFFPQALLCLLALVKQWARRSVQETRAQEGIVVLEDFELGQQVGKQQKISIKNTLKVNDCLIFQRLTKPTHPLTTLS